MFAAVFAAAGTVVAKENAYDFRKRLEIVHEEGLRDATLRPTADEIVPPLIVATSPDACHG